MNQQTLLRFIRQIISTGADGPQSALALRELGAILKKQGASQEDLALVETAVQGLTDSGTTMLKEMSAIQTLSPEELKNMVIRAHEQKLRQEEAERNGRC